MSLGVRLELNQSQQLVMTPQLQQAIKLLQMSNIELCSYVADEIERNPLLELADQSLSEGSELEPTKKAERTDEQADPAQDRPFEAETLHVLREDTSEDCPSDRPIEPAPEGWSTVGAGGNLNFEARHGDLDGRLGEKPTLRSHLLSQIGEFKIDPNTRRLAEQIVGDVDEFGFYRGALIEFAVRLGAGIAQSEEALRLVQTCEPTGVGARSLAECFALQLAERDRLDPAMSTLLENIELLSNGSISSLQTRCGVDEVDFQDMLTELRTLSPRPGVAYGQHEAQTLIPDVLLRRTSSGGWSVDLNPDTLPRVLIDNRYAAEFELGGADAREFISNCRNNANWLIKSLDQRARTILRVSTEIVKQQEAFFAEGIAALRPLTLKTIADSLEIHESTASRVTANKFISTERGMFEMKFFFTNAVGSGDAISAESVRHRVKSVVSKEDPTNILSDDAIVDILQKDGIDIARRTVAKYRKSLKIPSSIERRRLKAQCAI